MRVDHAGDRFWNEFQHPAELHTLIPWVNTFSHFCVFFCDFDKYNIGWANWEDCCPRTLYGFWCVRSYSTYSRDERFQGHCCREQRPWLSYISGNGSLTFLWQSYLSRDKTYLQFIIACYQVLWWKHDK